MHRSTALLLTALTLAACDSPETRASLDKGSEELALVGGKADSFFKPAEHGSLGFAISNQAAVDDDNRFHAWEFTLSGEATVSLHTEISKNLDTVMYLYRREPGETSWGPFVEKNDDFEGNLFSQIDFDGEAAEYRVLVKPFKTAMRRDFTLRASCDGDGCPKAGSDTCDPDEFTSLPDESALTSGCAERYIDALRGEVEFTNERALSLDERCDLDGLDLISVDLYHEWWDDIVGFEDAFGLEPGETMDLELSLEGMDGGSNVTVDGFGDEDAITFTFDGKGELLGMYQHNQSPTVEWFCGDDGTAKIEAPDEDCASLTRRALPHGDDVGGESGKVSAEDAAGRDGRIAAAVSHFVDARGLDDKTEVEFDAQLWESTDFEQAAEIEVSDGTATVTYWVADEGFGGVQVLALRDADGTRFVCSN